MVLFLGRGDLNTGAKGPKCSSTTGNSWETNKHCDVALLWQLAVIVGLMQVREPFGVIVDSIVLQAPG